MSSRRSLPRIRIDSLNSFFPHDLSPSPTLDIRDLLGEAMLYPALLTEDLMFEDVNDVLLFEEGCFQGVPTFPGGHLPPLFIVNSHRAQLPFPLRPEAFELGGFCQDEGCGSLLLTAPTIPRMKLMLMEQLCVQKWVDTLTFHNPPKHIPWTYDTPSPEKKWISEGSIFPADLIKDSAEQRRYIRGRCGEGNTDEMQALLGDGSNSRDIPAFQKAPPSTNRRTRSHILTSSIIAKPGDVATKLHAETKKFSTAVSQRPRRITSAPQALSSFPSVMPNGATGTTPIVAFAAPLATRRGKALSSLNLKGTLIEDLDYPDIPTAFRGSPSIWSPQFNCRLAAPFFTAHQDMLSDLKSKCAALGDGSSISVRAPDGRNGQWPETERTFTSVDADDGAYPTGLSSFERTLLGSLDEFTQVHREIIADTSIFLPYDSSTPVKGPHVGLEPHPRLLMPVLQSQADPSNSPPRVPLPPRPALVNPTTPPHVRGILKKVKSVRFEDAIVKEPQNHASSIPSSPPEGVSKPSLSLRQTTTVLPERPRTPIPSKVNETKGLAKMKVTGGIPGTGFSKNPSEKKPTPVRPPRLTPRRVKSGGDVASLRPKDSNAPEPTLPFKPTPTTSSVDRPCRIAHAKDLTNPIATSATPGMPKGSPATGVDLRRGIEGTAKHRMSTPLRNIFRFK